MKICPSERCTRTIAAAVLLVLWIDWNHPAATTARGAEVTAAAKRASGSVTVTADELISDDVSKTAEFIGNVKVIRGEYTLSADRLVVLYDREEKSQKGNAGDRSFIRSAVAEGNVRIQSKDLTASARKASYDRNSRTIELSGDSSATTGGGTISGHTLILYMENEQVKVSGSTENRVKAVFPAPEKK